MLLREGILMTTNSTFLTLLKCPFCVSPKGVLAVDPDRIRLVNCWGLKTAPKLGLRKAANAGIVVFNPDVAAGRPCRHLVLMAGNLGWVGAEPDRGMLSMGTVRVHWCVPPARPAVGSRWTNADSALAILRDREENDSGQPIVSYQLVEASVSHKNLADSEGGWNCCLRADAVYSRAPTRFVANLAAFLGRQ